MGKLIWLNRLARKKKHVLLFSLTKAVVLLGILQREEDFCYKYVHSCPFIKHPLIRLPMHISFELKWLLRLPVAAAADVQTIESPLNL